MMGLADFQNAVEDAGGEYIGEYGGRFGFKGYAASFGDIGSLVTLGAYLQEMALDDPPVEGASELLNRAPHLDSLGMGIVIAWPKSLFLLGED